MAKKRNVENIRRKNVEDNHRFLEQLRLSTARDEFVQTARSIHRTNQNNPMKKTYQKIERSTRYNEKVKSGEIPPFVPEWQRLKEEKEKETAKKLLERQRRKHELLVQRELRQLEKQRQKEERLLQQQQRNEERLIRQKLKEDEKQQRNEERLFQQELYKIERQLKYEEQRRIRLANQKPVRWGLEYITHSNERPYERIFKPRNTFTSQRAEHNSS